MGRKPSSTTRLQASISARGETASVAWEYRTASANATRIRFVMFPYAQTERSVWSRPPPDAGRNPQQRRTQLLFPQLQRRERRFRFCFCPGLNYVEPGLGSNQLHVRDGLREVLEANHGGFFRIRFFEHDDVAWLHGGDGVSGFLRAGCNGDAVGRHGASDASRSSRRKRLDTSGLEPLSTGKLLAARQASKYRIAAGPSARFGPIRLWSPSVPLCRCSY